MSSLEASRLNVFFYGLFMGAEVLRSHGVAPRNARIAFIPDHLVTLGAKAMLLPVSGRCGLGMLHALTRAEFDALYVNAPGYRETAFIARLANGNAAPAISMVHTPPPIGLAEDPAYAAQWKSLVERLRLPLDIQTSH